MYTIKTLNAISPVGLAKLPKNQFDVTVDADAPDGILVRSADLLNTTFNDNLLAIARAGAGVNNIPLERCSEQGIVVFNTPGANANAVAELVIGMLIAGSRNVAAAAQWCQGLAGDPAMSKSVEKGKKQFVGNEIKGKTLGVIGLGAIGSRVANCAIELGMEVYGYDPYISIEAAWNLSSQVHHCVNLNDMLPLCDYITIHVPYLPTTKDTINAQTLALCKDGVKILNYARGELVNTAALLEAMDSGKVSGYMTDFPSEDILGRPGIVCTPHLGASTPEAEDNCAVMAAKELSDYLKNGNITHSVNLPDVSQPRVGGKRICIIHRNEPGAISAITGILTAANLNIENMVNKGRKNVAYTMLDVTGNVDAGLTAQLSGIDTAIGKSYATGFLAREWNREGIKTITQKFIQTGNTEISEDIEVHRQIMGTGLVEADRERLTMPEIFTYPCSPHLAAEIDHRDIDFDKIEQASQALLQSYDRVLLEGAGGLMVPLTRDLLTIDYVAQKNYPLILVTSGRLGSINHTLLSLEAIEKRGIRLHSVLYNLYPENEDKIIQHDTEEYIRTWLERHFPETEFIRVPCL